MPYQPGNYSRKCGQSPDPNPPPPPVLKPIRAGVLLTCRPSCGASGSQPARFQHTARQPGAGSRRKTPPCSISSISSVRPANRHHGKPFKGPWPYSEERGAGTTAGNGRHRAAARQRLAESPGRATRPPATRPPAPPRLFQSILPARLRAAGGTHRRKEPASQTGVVHMKLFEHPDFDQAILQAAEHFRPPGRRPSVIEVLRSIPTAHVTMISAAGSGRRRRDRARTRWPRATSPEVLAHSASSASNRCPAVATRNAANATKASHPIARYE